VEHLARARPRSRLTFGCPPLPPSVILTGPTPAATSPHRESASAADTHVFLHGRHSLPSLALRCMSVPPSVLQLSSVHASYALRCGVADCLLSPDSIKPLLRRGHAHPPRPFPLPFARTYKPSSNGSYLASNGCSFASKPLASFLATSGACLHPRPPVTAPASASPRCLVPRRRSPRH
jgi:hypothetical protein